MVKFYAIFITIIIFLFIDMNNLMIFSKKHNKFKKFFYQFFCFFLIMYLNNINKNENLAN